MGKKSLVHAFEALPVEIVTLLPSNSTEVVPHPSVTNVNFGSEVEARVVREEGKRPCSYIKGAEFIRLGGDPDAFNPNGIYMWGYFK